MCKCAGRHEHIAFIMWMFYSCNYTEISSKNNKNENVIYSKEKPHIFLSFFFLFFENFSTAFTFISHHNICSLFYLRDRTDSAQMHMYLGGFCCGISTIFMAKMCFVSFLMNTACVSPSDLAKDHQKRHYTDYFCGEYREFSVILP